MAQAIPYLIAGGTIISSVGQLQAGSAQNRMMRDQARMAEASANREAQVLEIKANEDQAVSQRRAQEARRQSRIQQSRALAVAASSGAGTATCTGGTSCATYTITFGLEGTTGGLGSGPHTASPNGIQ